MPIPAGMAESSTTRLRRYRSMRDFGKTAEPAGAAKPKRARKKVKLPEFVVQKHAATNLHFDLRLENEGVMKSWAVPKGPSLDPSVKRLAMQVEDHPIEYNSFEGTIPEGEYGGGTVMIWDRGTFTADKADDGDHEAAVREGLRKGDLKFTLKGDRLKGSFVLVRTRPSASGKPQWLLIKHRDEFASPGSDITAEQIPSVVSGRTMEEIATGDALVWRSNRPAKRNVRIQPGQKTLERARKADAMGAGTAAGTAPAKKGRKSAARSARSTSTGKQAVPARSIDPSRTILPMLASPAKEMPGGDNWTYEPKLDGIRVLAYVTPDDVRLITRNAKDKTKQFPEIVADLEKLPGRTGSSLVLDGEIVALEDGEPARFQALQSRMHVENTRAIVQHAKSTPGALIAFDILVDGADALLDEPWTQRRKRLVKRLARRKLAGVRLIGSTPDGEEMLKQALSEGWEGVIAKKMDSAYRPGQRSRDWLKLKIEQRQEFVIGGFTEPRNSREHIGALLLGYYDDEGRLIYAGHTGGGFTRAALRDVYNRLHPGERKSSPFTTTPKTNEKAHWVIPELVAEVKFNEWTREGKLRQPIFLGLRDDKDPREVRREQPR